MAFRNRFWDHFHGTWRSKNEQKCGRVCSDSLFSVRNLTSNLEAFWTAFWEGLGAVLAGLWLLVGVKSCLTGMLKASAFSRCVLKPKNAETSRYFEGRRCGVQAGEGRGSPSCLNPPWIRGAGGPRPYPIEYFFDIQYHLYRLHVIYLPDRGMRTKFF